MQEQVELMATGLEPGTSLRDICPVCGGGGSKERSLSITVSEDGWLLWRCFRASCGHKGRKPLWGVVRGVQGTPQKPPQTFSGALIELPDDALCWFRDNFGLRGMMLDGLSWRFAPDCDRIYIPYIGPRGQFRGSLLREWKNKLTPRNLVYKEIRDEPFMGWFPETGSGPPVLVEDAISAFKVYQSGINSISLCGTHLSPNMVREILTRFPSAILALDKDAYAKAVGMAGEFRGVIDLKLWKLEKDLKYVSEERIRAAYFEDKTDFGAGYD
jgi:hypothetical protein